MAVISLIAILFVKHYQIFIRYNFNAAATETNCPAWAGIGQCSCFCPIFIKIQYQIKD